MTEDSMHRTLDAALARNSGPSAEDVDARPIAVEFAVVVAALLAGRIDGQQAVASLAAIHTHILAAAKREGARAVVKAVEAELAAEEARLAPFRPDPSGLLGNWLGGIRIAGHAAREAATRFEGGA